MWSLHAFLTEKFAWYKKWEENSISTAVHLALFGLFATFAFSVVFNQVAELAIINEGAQVAIVTMSSRATRSLLPEHSRAESREVSEIIVVFSQSVGETKRSEIAKAQLLTKRGEIPKLNAVIFAIDENDTALEAANRIGYMHKNEVLFAEPNAIVPPEYLTNDPLLSGQWHIPKIGADTVWDSTHGENIVVGVLDTGVDCIHPDLAQNCVPGFNTASNNTNSSDLYGHGTKVAGVISAIGDNTLGVAGTAYGAKIMPIRVTNDAQGLASYSDIANGILYAADHNVRIANVSYGAYDSQTIASAAQYLASKGGILTMSAGNAGTVSSVKNDPNIIVVSATDMGDVRASWSSYGSPVDVAAPGLAISTTASGGGFISMSGTSFSSPMTAAVAALVWSKVPNLSNAQLTQVLLGTALDKGAAGYDQEYGFGRIDAHAALNAALSGTTPTITYQTGGQNQQFALTSYAVVSKTRDSGSIAWATNLPATGRVRYGIGTNALSLSSGIASSSVTQQITVSGLDPRKKYYYQIEATDASGAIAKSPVTEFRTRR
jgi:subtilisin family serine protease